MLANNTITHRPLVRHVCNMQVNQTTLKNWALYTDYGLHMCNQ